MEEYANCSLVFVKLCTCLVGGFVLL